MKKSVDQMKSFVFGAYGHSAFCEKKRPLVWDLYEYGEQLYAAAVEVLPERPFDKTHQKNDWKDSELRAWLNHEFLNQAFTEEEREAIVRHKAEYKPNYEIEQVCECEDYISIASTKKWFLSGKKKSVYNQLAEGDFGGAWLMEGVKVDRVSYVDENRRIHIKYGKVPEERLSVAPIMWLDKNKLKPIEIQEYLTKPQQGILLGSASGVREHFYCEDGTYIQVHEDRLSEFCYVKTAVEEAVIVGWLGNRDVEEIVFPGEIEGLKVVGILGEYRDLNVKQIVVKEGIAFIGEESFVFLPKLENIQLPSTLMKFPGTNLIGCPCVKKINLSPENKFYINDNGVIYTRDKKVLVKYTVGSNTYILSDSVEEIEPGAFCDVGSLQELMLPAGIQQIKPYAFAHADIPVIYFHDKVKRIEKYAFKNSFIKEINLSESVDTIESSAFAGCEQLQKVDIPSKFEKRYQELFQDCRILEYTQKAKLEECIYCSGSEEIRNAEAGDVITFGSYMQHAAGEMSTPLEWIVLQRKRNQLLLLSKYALFEAEYDLRMNGAVSHKQNLSVDWKESGLRELLNETFLQEAFQDIELECIAETYIKEEGDYFVQSKIFCLSKEEAGQFLGSEEIRRACRTDYCCVHDRKGRETAWWLRSSMKNKEDGRGVDMVLKDGTFDVRPSNAVLSVRPAMWIDLYQTETLLKQNNVEYIKTWFLDNNDYLPMRKDREELLELLAVYTIMLEKISGLAKNDYIVKKDKDIRIVSGPPEKNEKVLQILKIINYSYAYLDLADAKKCAVYNYLYKEEYFSGILSEYIVSAYFGTWGNKLFRHHEGRNFEKTIYKCNRNVFYSDYVLTEKEMEVLWKVQADDQIQFEVFHDEEGKMFIW